MGETTGEPHSEPLDVAAALTAARGLLASAEADAAQLRSDALHYVRQREQEAELLVAKARRLLSVAEEKAAGIVASARATASAPVRLDLDAPSVTVPLADLHADDLRRIVSPRRASAAGLDGMLAAAIANAVDRTFPLADPQPR